MHLSHPLPSIAPSRQRAVAALPQRLSGPPQPDEWAVVGGCVGLYPIPVDQLKDYYRAFAYQAAAGFVLLIGWVIAQAWL